MNARGTGRRLSLAVAIHIVLASLIISQPVRPDHSLHASLDYSLLAQPYETSVRLNGTQTVAADRDPSSPYFGTIYAIGWGVSGSNESVVLQRSLDSGRAFGTPASFTACAAGNDSCRFNNPGIAVGTNGVVYIAAGGTIWRSADQGLSWQSAPIFTDPRFADKNGYPYVSIATDMATGAVYVGTVNSSKAVVVASSRDEGRTWTSSAVSGGVAGFVARGAALRKHLPVPFLLSHASTRDAAVALAASPDGG